MHKNFLSTYYAKLLAFEKLTVLLGRNKESKIHKKFQMLIGAGKKNEIVNLRDTDAGSEDRLLPGWQGREASGGHLNET